MSAATNNRQSKEAQHHKLPFALHCAPRRDGFYPFQGDAFVIIVAVSADTATIITKGAAISFLKSADGHTEAAQKAKQALTSTLRYGRKKHSINHAPGHTF
ncbi:hypothetical protein ACQZV8_18150 [Magnetococcales bacterium HHB-1]